MNLTVFTVIGRIAFLFAGAISLAAFMVRIDSVRLVHLFFGMLCSVLGFIDVKDFFITKDGFK